MTNINKSITATIKSISEKRNLIFIFNNKITKIEGNKVFLPNSELLKKKNDVKNYRGIADFLALKLKYHNTSIYKKYKPKDIISKEIFDAIEETRIITLGSSYMDGIASNLRSRIEFFCKKNQFNKIKKRNNSQITQVIKLLSSEYLLKEKLPKNTVSFMNLWKPIIMPLIIENLVEIKKELINQKSFSEQSLEIIKKVRKFCKNKKHFEKQKKKLREKEKTYSKKSSEEKFDNINNSFFTDKEIGSSKKNLNQIMQPLDFIIILILWLILQKRY